jgi:hypothetical protein
MSTEAIANGTLLGTNVPAVVQKLFQAVKPTATPTSIPQALTAAAGAFGVSGTPQAPALESDILSNVLTLVLDGSTSSDLNSLIQGTVSFQLFVFQVQKLIEDNRVHSRTVMQMSTVPYPSSRHSTILFPVMHRFPSLSPFCEQQYIFHPASPGVRNNRS